MENTVLWYHVHKTEYQIANAQFEELIQALMLRIYEKEHPQAEYLKYKSWYLEYPIQDEELADGELFLSKAVDIFHRMKPYNDYLNRALVGFKMPER